MVLTAVLAVLILSVSSAWLIQQIIAPNYFVLFPILLTWGIGFFLVSFGMFRMLPLSPRLFHQFSLSLFLSGFAAFVVLWVLPPIAHWTIAIALPANWPTANPPLLWSLQHWFLSLSTVFAPIVACWLFLPLPLSNSQFWRGAWLGFLTGTQLTGVLPIAITTLPIPRQSNWLSFLGGLTFGLISLPVLAGPPILDYWHLIHTLTWQKSLIQQITSLNTFSTNLLTALLLLIFCALWGVFAWRKAWWHAASYTRLLPYFRVVRNSWVWTLIASPLIASSFLVWWSITWSIFPVLVRCPPRILQSLLLIAALTGGILALYLYMT